MRKRRLKGASDNILKAQAAMAMQRAETLYYRHFRLWLNKTFKGELRLGFGWTAKKFISELLHQRVVKGALGDNVTADDRKDEHQKIASEVQHWYLEPYHAMYQKAQSMYGLAVDAVETGDTDGMTESFLKTVIYSAGEQVPYINPKRCR